MRQIMPKTTLGIFVLMFFAALVLGLSSYNLFYFVRANFELIYKHGWMALLDGALLQLVWLIAYGVLSLSSFIVFEACKKLMLEKILDH